MAKNLFAVWQELAKVFSKGSSSLYLWVAVGIKMFIQEKGKPLMWVSNKSRDAKTSEEIDARAARKAKRRARKAAEKSVSNSNDFTQDEQR